MEHLNQIKCMVFRHQTLQTAFAAILCRFLTLSTPTSLTRPQQSCLTTTHSDCKQLSMLEIEALQIEKSVF